MLHEVGVGCQQHYPIEQEAKEGKLDVLISTDTLHKVHTRIFHGIAGRRPRTHACRIPRYATLDVAASDHMLQYGATPCYSEP